MKKYIIHPSRKIPNYNTLKWLNVELSSVCNLSCVSCSFKSGKRDSYISDDTLSRIFSEIRTVKVKIIPWFSGGEIGTIPNKKLRNICNQISEFRKKQPFSSQVFSNGTLMDDEKIDILINSGSFDKITISADGPNKSFFEKNRIRHNKTPFPWEQFLNNIERLLISNSKRNNPIVIGFNCLVSGSPDPKFLKLLKNYPSATYNAAYRHNFIEGRCGSGRKNRCKWQHNQIVIMSNGKYTTCCNDVNGVNVFGDIKTMPLLEAMNLPFNQKYGIGCRTCVQ